MVVIQMSEGSTLNVRNQPSTEGEVMGYLENGDMMPFMSESGDWYQIEIEEGLSGWISKQYSTVRKTSQIASAPVASEPVPESAPVPSSPAPEEELSSELTPLGSEPQQPKGSIVIVYCQ